MTLPLPTTVSDPAVQMCLDFLAMRPPGFPLPVKTKAGIPSDADFAVKPPDGTTVLDTADNRLYIRSGGAWKYAALT